MKTLLCLFSGVCALVTTGCVGVSSVAAESPVPVVVAPPPAEAGSLDELVAPIALYPDALVALILPAATTSSDVVLAARYLAANGDRNEIDAQPWDESVKGLARYPDVVEWMDENLVWTQRLGEAYLDQPQEVMAAIQRDRARARVSGILNDTDQQQIVIEDGNIRIIPAQTNVIYVPRYDPEIVYVERPVYYGPDPWITFGVGFGVGSWLAYDLDWRARRVWYDHHRRAYWHDHRYDWRHPRFPDRRGHVHRPGWEPWRPKPGRTPPPHRRHFEPGHRNMPHPAPIAGAPRFDREHRRPRPDRIDRPDHFGSRAGRYPEGRPRPDRVGRERPRPDRTPEVTAQPAPSRDRAREASAAAPQVGPARGSRDDAAAVQGTEVPRMREQNGERRDRRRDEDRRSWRGPSNRRPDVAGRPPQVQQQVAPAVSQAIPAQRPAAQVRQVRPDGNQAGRGRAPDMRGQRQVHPAQPAARVHAAPPPRAVPSSPPAATTIRPAAPAVQAAAPVAAPRIAESRPASAPPQARSESRGGGHNPDRGGRGHHRPQER